jgi:hypothetical protein
MLKYLFTQLTNSIRESVNMEAPCMIFSKPQGAAMSAVKSLSAFLFA